MKYHLAEMSPQARFTNEPGLESSNITFPHSKEPMLPNEVPPQEQKTMVRSGCQPARVWAVMEAMIWVMTAEPFPQSANAPSYQLPWRLPNSTYRSTRGNRAETLRHKTRNKQMLTHQQTCSCKRRVNQLLPYENKENIFLFKFMF